MFNEQIKGFLCYMNHSPSNKSHRIAVIYFGSLIALVITALTTVSLYAQPTKHLSAEDSAAVNALVMYPASVRRDIFEVCMYPATIVNIASLQKISSVEFTELISNFNKEEQEDYWNLSRYPGLIHQLANENKKSKEEITIILEKYPEEILEKSIIYGTKHYDLLRTIDNLQTKTNNSFEDIISDYSITTQGALRELIQYPEIITLLNEHLNLAVRAGDHYRRDPQGILHRADSINLAITRQNAIDAASWKSDIQNDPESASDLKNAAGEYAKENGYSDEDINTVPEDNYISNYRCYPFPYWFGYPVWYPYHYWYPYPYWFDCGFYYDRFGQMVFIGYPSFYFTSWYFYHPHHWKHFPHLCNTYINHYYGPRISPGSNSGIVHRWIKDNQNSLPSDFIANHTKRLETIKEVGQLNIDMQKQQNGRPITPTDKDQYLQNNARKYPSLKTNSSEKLNIEKSEKGIPDAVLQPVKQPAVKIPTQELKPVSTPRQEPHEPAYEFDKMNKAVDYHRNTWEQNQPAPIQRQQQNMTPRVQPPRQQQIQQQQPSQQQAPRQSNPTQGASPIRRR